MIRPFLAFFIAVTLVVAFHGCARAHMPDRPELNDWFGHLYSGKGVCCSGSEATVVIDPDWDSVDGHYRVKLDDQWIAVPDAAVIKEPNRYGPTLVWPIKNTNGEETIRCFLPGAGG